MSSVWKLTSAVPLHTDYKERHHSNNASVRDDLENAANDFFFAGNVKAAEISGGTCGPLSLRLTDTFPHGADTNWRRSVQRLGRIPDTSDPAYKMLAWSTGRPWLGAPRQAEHWDMERFSPRLCQSGLRHVRELEEGGGDAVS